MDSDNVLASYMACETLEQNTPETIDALKGAVADHFACVISGSRAPVSSIAKRFAAAQWGAGESSILLEEEKTKPAGAAFANAVAANALDLDDGHRLTKGHPGAVVIPAVLAAAEDSGATWKEFLEAVLVGYEIGIRAGILAHQNRPDYHCTGSWGAIGAAAGAGRIMGLNGEEMLHALGIAEYHSTYSPMMRCIDVPSMLKDGIGWGCMTGLSAAYLAKFQFTGIPSLFSGPGGAEHIGNLGIVHQIRRLYYKPHACCRWAQPAVECLAELERRADIRYGDISKITVSTFTESARLSRKAPATTEEAQYNLLFPIAAYLTFGRIGPDEVLYELQNSQVLALMEKIEIRVDEKFDQAFPATARSQVRIHTKTGEIFDSPVMQAKGDHDFPLSLAEKEAKFLFLTSPVIGEQRSQKLFDCISQLERAEDIGELLSIIHKKQKKLNLIGGC